MNYPTYIKQIARILRIPTPALPENDDAQIALLEKLLNLLEKQVNELYQFTYDLADGTLDGQYTRENQLLGPLKDLSSSLNYFTYSINEVTKGNYEQRIHFLGHYSDAFNLMVEKLKENETLKKTNERYLKDMHQQEVHHLQSLLDAQIENHKQVLEMNQQVRSFRHDIRNHLLALSSLLKQNKTEKALKYLQHSFQLLEANDNRAHTGNDVFDYLLSLKLKECETLQVTLETKIESIPHMKVDDIDWSILLGNAFDNAIDAWKKIKDPLRRKGSFRFFANEVMISFQLENTYQIKPAFDEKGELLSGKEDCVNHGIGLKNIKRTVEKYHGEMEITHNETTFSLLITLFP